MFMLIRIFHKLLDPSNIKNIIKQKNAEASKYELVP